MFHDASPASVRPAFNPTRGSGLGGRIDIPFEDGAAAAVAPPEEEHAAIENNPTTNVARESIVALRRMPPCHTVDWTLTGHTPVMCD
jgi:hypothetical protein